MTLTNWIIQQRMGHVLSEVSAGPVWAERAGTALHYSWLLAAQIEELWPVLVFGTLLLQRSFPNMINAAGGRALPAVQLCSEISTASSCTCGLEISAGSLMCCDSVGGDLSPCLLLSSSAH